MNPGDPERSSDAVATRRRRLRWQTLANGASLYGAVTLGGVLGSLLRWAVSLALPFAGNGLPLATLLANVSGCFVIGFYSALTGPGGRVYAGPRMRQFVMTGLCGGYTTFSGFSVETVGLVMADDARVALLYGAISVVTWLAAVWLGDVLAWRLNNRTRP